MRKKNGLTIVDQAIEQVPGFSNVASNRNNQFLIQ